MYRDKRGLRVAPRKLFAQLIAIRIQNEAAQNRAVHLFVIPYPAQPVFDIHIPAQIHVYGH